MNTFFKQILLSLALIIIIKLIFSLPILEIWWKNRLGSYYLEYKSRKKNIKAEEKWVNRHGMEYEIPKFIQKNINPQKDIFLFPPAQYLKDVLGEQAPTQWLDKRWFCYMAESKILTITIEDSMFLKANKTFMYNTISGFFIQEMTDSSSRAKVIEAFLPYKKQI